MATFDNFVWKENVFCKDGTVYNFEELNILYGRNYSGKTTLSRIFRALETGQLSDKFEAPDFSVAFDGPSQIATQDNLTEHDHKIRVFNEDFVRDNLRFIANPEEGVTPFAVLGDSNNETEKEIEKLETELGSNKENKETGLYAQLKNAEKEHKLALTALQKADNDIEDKLKYKATDKNRGIRNQPERFGDQNYNITKIRVDIETVRDSNYHSPTDDQLVEYDRCITEKPLEPIPTFHKPSLSFSSLGNEVEALVTKEISKSHKIEELTRDALLNRWVQEGQALHKDKRDKCAFCDNSISDDRWSKLERHFDEESKNLEEDIETLIGKITKEKENINKALLIDANMFYSNFSEQINLLKTSLEDAVINYTGSLDWLTEQLDSRKKDIINQRDFKCPENITFDLDVVFDSYEKIRLESNNFSDKLEKGQADAKKCLRLNEVSIFCKVINYNRQIAVIDKLNIDKTNKESYKNKLRKEVRVKLELITSKKLELNDEEKAANRVNEYVNNFFGHQSLCLKAINDEFAEEKSKQVRFEVMRDGRKAYCLSEGECSLLAFCYFWARLDDIDTNDSEPIIWIDDPISSLDGNHIFFIYSLIATRVHNKQFKQLFVSTHSLEFLKYLKRLNCPPQTQCQKSYFIVLREGSASTIKKMPKYMKEYVTEFNYLFHQIHKCASLETINNENYTTFYNFGNNARKFLEIYLYYKYPSKDTKEALKLFFDDEKSAIAVDRINNEYSHLIGCLERGSTPVEVPEMLSLAKKIIERLKYIDSEQYLSLCESIPELNQETIKS